VGVGKEAKGANTRATIAIILSIVAALIAAAPYIKALRSSGP